MALDVVAQVAQIVGTGGTLAAAVAALISSRAALRSSKAALQQLQSAQLTSRLSTQAQRPELRLEIDEYGIDGEFFLIATLHNDDREKSAREVMVSLWTHGGNRGVDEKATLIGPGESLVVKSGIPARVARATDVMGDSGKRHSEHTGFANVLYADNLRAYSYSERRPIVEHAALTQDTNELSRFYEARIFSESILPYSQQDHVLGDYVSEVQL